MRGIAIWLGDNVLIELTQCFEDIGLGAWLYFGEVLVLDVRLLAWELGIQIGNNILEEDQ